MPVPYTGRPPHIHVKIHGDKREYLTSQIYLKGKEKESGVFGLLSGDRGNLTIDPVKGSGDVKQARFDFVIERNV
jgi:protocatechuate 3,4-dioxygenase beta subunit